MNDFLENFFQELTGKKISSKQKILLEAAFLEFFDFQEDKIEPPSSHVAMLSSACGMKLPQVLSSTINTFGKYHFCFSDAAEFILHNYYTTKKYFPGFGHSKYKKYDPRVKRLLSKANKLNYTNQYLISSLEFSKKNKILLNFSGFIVCVLLDCGCNIYNIDLFPIVCRMVGLTKIYEKVNVKKIKFASAYEIATKFNSTRRI